MKRQWRKHCLSGSLPFYILSESKLRIERLLDAIDLQKASNADTDVQQRPFGYTTMYLPKAPVDPWSGTTLWYVYVCLYKPDLFMVSGIRNKRLWPKSQNRILIVNTTIAIKRLNTSQMSSGPNKAKEVTVQRCPLAVHVYQDIRMVV